MQAQAQATYRRSNVLICPKQKALMINALLRLRMLLVLVLVSLVKTRLNRLYTAYQLQKRPSDFSAILRNMHARELRIHWSETDYSLILRHRTVVRH